MVSAFIEDGYTPTVGIEGVDRLYPEMVFRYRPYAGTEATEAYRRILQGPTAMHRDFSKRKPAKIAKEQTSEAVERRLLETMCSRIESWGFDRDVSPESLKKLHPALFTRLQAILFGNDAPDFELNAEGKRIEPSDEEEDAKN